jgi:DNA-binding transcriptional LysR family regulator
LAAEKLNMSKSAVSQHIKRLEQDTGQQLLSRHTRGMSLTAAGEKLLSRCELLRDQVEFAYDELTVSKEMPSGIFALTIPHSFEKNIIVPALKQLCLEFPLLQIDLRVTDKPLDLIENNLDVSIYGGKLKDSNYRSLSIGSPNEFFCASPSYLQKHRKLSILKDLHNHQVIGTPWQKQALELFENNTPSEMQSVKLNYFAKTNTMTSVMECILQDMGIALLPEFSIQSALAKGELVRVLTQYQGKKCPFYMVHRFHGEKPVHITRFYHLVKHYFSKQNC